MIKSFSKSAKSLQKLASGENPPHPGEVLRQLCVVEQGMDTASLAARLQVPPSQLEQLLDGKLSVDAALASVLASALGTSQALWLNLQRSYDRSQRIVAR